MNKIEFITLSAKRVVTFFVDGNHHQIHVVAYKPARRSVMSLCRPDRRAVPFRLDISDKTGKFMTGAKWKMKSIVRSDDDKVFNMTLTLCGSQPENAK